MSFEANNRDRHRFAQGAKSFGALAASDTARNHDPNLGIRVSTAGNYKLTPREGDPADDGVAVEMTVALLAGEVLALDIAQMAQTPTGASYIVFFA